MFEVGPIRDRALRVCRAAQIKAATSGKDIFAEPLEVRQKVMLGLGRQIIGRVAARQSRGCIDLVKGVGHDDEAIWLLRRQLRGHKQAFACPVQGQDLDLWVNQSIGEAETALQPGVNGVSQDGQTLNWRIPIIAIRLGQARQHILGRRVTRLTEGERNFAVARHYAIEQGSQPGKRATRKRRKTIIQYTMTHVIPTKISQRNLAYGATLTYAAA